MSGNGAGRPGVKISAVNKVVDELRVLLETAEEADEWQYAGPIQVAKEAAEKIVKSIIEHRSGETGKEVVPGKGNRRARGNGESTVDHVDTFPT